MRSLQTIERLWVLPVLDVETGKFAGKYDRSMHCISGRLTPLGGMKEVKSTPVPVVVSVIRFESALITNRIVAEMEVHNFRPSLASEILGIGAQYPDLQKRYPIAALGTEIHLFAMALYFCLDYVHRERQLYLYSPVCAWEKGWHFLVAKKDS